ncbi:helix-turn-helix domain-containing protein (plasmid) [Pseudomonas silvicola]|nr:helix-turn-helix domain-containing protein [Pseudomonas silvicola]
MRNHLADAFSLSALALAAGLSDHQLKTGFQQHFHCTPGAMLLQMRMEHAYRLLEEGFQVAQAAWQVGYQHPHRNFSVAFQRAILDARPVRLPGAEEMVMQAIKRQCLLINHARLFKGLKYGIECMD